ncbi:hypothetical protein EVAR_51758_1 [Eumeta japonica]|uniref:Uncharacterized protein n=1 Tax=Eumeta variegata TaxID=151549 RepID=A0A4C1XCR8_EUMVA|nr:hypothetical protein EVAR_51758_1 [Eumeta japonica]
MFRARVLARSPPPSCAYPAACRRGAAHVRAGAFFSFCVESLCTPPAPSVVYLLYRSVPVSEASGIRTNARGRRRSARAGRRLRSGDHALANDRARGTRHVRIDGGPLALAL